jgi:L-fuconolactonase
MLAASSAASSELPMTPARPLVRRQVLALAAAAGFGAYAARSPAATPAPWFDAHSHLVSLDETAYPHAPADAPTSTGSLPGMGFRQFGVARPTPEADTIVKWMDQNGVDGLAAVQKRGTYGLDNRYILDSADRHPDRLFPVVILEAEDAATAPKVRELARDHRLAGVRLTGVMTPDGGFPWLNSEKALALWQAAQETGVAIDIMTQPFGHPDKAVDVYLDLAQRFPRVRIVLDHFGWPAADGAPDFGFDANLRRLASRPNVFHKFTTINMDKLQDQGIPAAGFLRHAVDVFGAGRIMWGSDMGNTPGTYPEMIARARAAGARLTAAEQRAVFHDTGRSVFTKRAA